MPSDHYPTLHPDEVRLVGEDGKPMQCFVLLFNPYSGRDMSAVYAAMSADPPAGCHWQDDRHHPRLYCARPGTDRFRAIAEVVREARERYRVSSELNDLGFEKLWEWFGGEDQGREMVAHLLLMAVHRAELVGIRPEELHSFLDAVAAPLAAERP
ncbi:hypothetical protein [Actinomadura sp. 6N118]|uniref:hypothetical protein n=1 Tax=Actinomadura sp. 6N118 TaxID=3375151 RepID=UPI0037A3D445